jgi:hypothetical protein
VTLFVVISETIWAGEWLIDPALVDVRRMMLLLGLFVLMSSRKAWGLRILSVNGCTRLIIWWVRVEQVSSQKHPNHADWVLLNVFRYRQEKEQLCT